MKKPPFKSKINISISDPGVNLLNEMRDLEEFRPSVTTSSTAEIEDLSKTHHRPVGFCIYCLSRTNLSREHVIPFALSGRLVLPKASCEHCSCITQEFEGKILRDSWRNVRVLRGMKSRSKHDGASATLPFVFLRNGVSEIVELPLDEYPILLPFPIFGTPKYLNGEGGTGITMAGLHTILFGPDPQEVFAKLGASGGTLEASNMHPVAFAKMLAKIGYSMAVSEGKIDPLGEPALVLPSILGQADDIGRWVGSISGPIQKFSGLLHRIGIHEDVERGLLIAEIQLFADCESPTYAVILAKLAPEP